MPQKPKSRRKRLKKEFFSSRETLGTYFDSEIKLYGGEAIRLTEDGLRALGIRRDHRVEAYYNPALNRLEIRYDTELGLKLAGEALLNEKRQELFVMLYGLTNNYVETWRLSLYYDEFQRAKKFFDKKKKDSKETYEFLAWILKKLLAIDQSIIARLNKG